MKTLGLTGGIGAGKTAVASLFEEKGIAVYNSDQEAKKIYFDVSEVKQKVITLLGQSAYNGDIPDFKFIAQEVFTNPKALQNLNDIIHPEVQKSFESWKAQQTSDFVVKEAAILFESGSYKQCDAVLTVTADEDIRLERVMKRDAVSEEKVLDRMSKQWPEQRKIELSDFVIINNGDFQQLEYNFNEVYPDIEFRLS